MTEQVPRAALVTGAARRIGRAIALALHEAGYAVAIQANRSVVEAESLRDEIARAGGHAAVLRADLSDHAAVAALIAAAAGTVGSLTLLVNNAAMFEPDAIGALDPKRFDRQFAVNLRAPLFLSEAFGAQAPPSANASIVNILDQRVFKLTPHFVSYTLAKSALHAATRMLAQALAPNVRVNAVAPGPTLASARQQQQDFARQAAAVPLGHGPSAEEIAGAVVYLAGARSITGVTLAVDGARKAHGEADTKLVRTVASEAGPTVEWLGDTYALPFEVITDFNYPGHSAHRMHGLPSRTGAELIDRLRGAVEARGIPLLTGRVCETLFADEDHFVEGVKVLGREAAGETIGCGALVLACNGYGGHPRLVRR